MARLWVLGVLLGGCVAAAPPRRNVTVSRVRLDCPSRGTVVASNENGLRAEAAKIGANHVVVIGEGVRRDYGWGKRYAQTQRLLEGEALYCEAR